MASDPLTHTSPAVARFQAAFVDEHADAWLRAYLGFDAAVVACRAVLRGEEVITMPDCLNLLERFGVVFRVSFDPAYSPRHVPREKLDPWMMQLPCRRGVIYPHGGDRLAVEVDGRPKAAKKLASLPGVVLHQDGDREKTFLFSVEMFDQVAALVQPRKRRRLSEAHRAALAEGGAATRFPSRLSGASRAS